MSDSSEEQKKKMEKKNGVSGEYQDSDEDSSLDEIEMKEMNSPV